MKNIFKPMFLTLLFMSIFMSCNNEELFVESIAEVVDSEQTEDFPEEELEGTEEGSQVDTNSPCDFNLNTLQSGDTVVINCVMDLGGATITLPPNVTIAYEGGDIVNGTLNFSDNTTFDGNLMNATLTMSGSVPLLKDPVFNFIPSKWGIVEGKVSDIVATNNRNILNGIITKVKDMGVATFEIDTMDAYFDVSSGDVGKVAISIPSNFHFKMGDSCNLRVQPNGSEYYAILMAWGVDNITISGGKLWGDRFTHDYTTISGSHNWGHIIRFKAVHNGVIDNVEMHEGTGDGFHVTGGSEISNRNSDGSLKPGKKESFNITVKNCLIDNNRRNNIGIVDGTNIFIEYNTIRNAGSGDNTPGYSSNGTSPRCGIDIEAKKVNAPDNNSVYSYQNTENVHIRNNIFEDNYAVDIALFNGEKTYVYENTFRSQRGVSASYSYNNKIYDNTFERPEGLVSGSQAINLEPRYWADGRHRIIDFEVYNNTISGYQIGIVAGGNGNEFKNNVINNCKSAVVLVNSENLLFDNNTISSNIENSKGYLTFSTEDYIKNCSITNEEINVQNRGLFFTNKNNVNPGSITIDNVDFNSEISLINAQNITIKNSTFDNIKITDCEPILIDNNI